MSQFISLTYYQKNKRERNNDHILNSEEIEGSWRFNPDCLFLLIAVFKWLDPYQERCGESRHGWNVAGWRHKGLAWYVAGYISRFIGRHFTAVIWIEKILYERKDKGRILKIKYWWKERQSEIYLWLPFCFNCQAKMTRSFFKGWWSGRRAIKSDSRFPSVLALSGGLNALMT